MLFGYMKLNLLNIPFAHWHNMCKCSTCIQ